MKWVGGGNGQMEEQHWSNVEILPMRAYSKERRAEGSLLKSTPNCNRVGVRTQVESRLMSGHSFRFKVKWGRSAGSLSCTRGAVFQKAAGWHPTDRFDKRLLIQLEFIKRIIRAVMSTVRSRQWKRIEISRNEISLNLIFASYTRICQS